MADGLTVEADRMRTAAGLRCEVLIRLDDAPEASDGHPSSNSADALLDTQPGSGVVRREDTDVPRLACTQAAPVNPDWAVWITDSTPGDLETRARHLALTTPLSFEHARDAIVRFSSAMAGVMRAFDDTPDALAALSAALDAPGRRTAMRSAYRPKTRRRNRR